MLRHFYCPVGSFIPFQLSVGPVSLVNGVSSSSVDVCRGWLVSFSLVASLYGVYL